MLVARGWEESYANHHASPDVADQDNPLIRNAKKNRVNDARDAKGQSWFDEDCDNPPSLSGMFSNSQAFNWHMCHNDTSTNERSNSHIEGDSQRHPGYSKALYATRKKSWIRQGAFNDRENAEDCLNPKFEFFGDDCGIDMHYRSK